MTDTRRDYEDPHRALLLPTDLDWPRLLRLAAICRIPVYRSDERGYLRRVTAEPTRKGRPHDR